MSSGDDRPIIKSLLDTDLYKFTMQQLAFHRFRDVEVEYRLFCRSAGVDLRPHAADIRRHIDYLATVRLTSEEEVFLQQLGPFRPDYLAALTSFRFDPADVSIKSDTEFELTIRGAWYQTILFEVPVLAIISEVYFRSISRGLRDPFAMGDERLSAKCAEARTAPPAQLQIIEFGTRRRCTGDWQQHVVERLSAEMAERFIGTSNVHIARRLGLNCYGTMAHEYLQAFQGFVPLREFQRAALACWLEEYPDAPGIALSDVVGTTAFLRDFDARIAAAYAGVRQDSGDPMGWGERIVQHYLNLGVDPMSRTAIFSDALTISRAIEIGRRFSGRIRTAFGIGTNLTNDTGLPPLNIVIKLVRSAGKPVGKLTDTPDKAIARDPMFMQTLRSTFPD